MAKSLQSLESLLAIGDWAQAQKRIAKELASDPENHWLLTQLGVTHYEQGHYQEALRVLASSLKIVPDCPLTLWNVAGVLDALQKPDDAIRVYTWILRSKKSAKDDSCWESQQWTDTLKTDCVFRIGVCFQHMKQWASAEHCFRQYINLDLAGTPGTYPIGDAATNVRELPARGRHQTDKARQAFLSTLEDEGIVSLEHDQRSLSELSLPELLPAG